MKSSSNDPLTSSRSNRIILKMMAISGLLLSIVACFHIEPNHKIVIRDAETQNPLDKTVVLLELNYSCLLPLNAGGPNSSYLAIEEGITDADGTSKLPINFYFLPPLMCSTNKFCTYFKPGYFPSHSYDNTSLYKMNYYLNFLPFKEPHTYFSWIGVKELGDECRYLKTALDETKNLQLIRGDDNGIFLRFPGMSFSQIYSRKANIRENPDNDIYYVYDEVSKNWISFNSRGKLLNMTDSNLPLWQFRDSNISWDFPIYASKNSIFYQKIEGDLSARHIYSNGEIQYITPHEGNITAIAGTNDNFFTIENDGLSLCNYSSYYHDQNGYLKTKSTPYFLNSYNGDALPHSQNDTSGYTRLKYIVQTINHEYFLVVKAPNDWHIYSFFKKSGKIEAGLDFEKLISFSSENDITAFAANGNHLYISFKNKGIKKFDIFRKQVREDISFLENSKAADYSDIACLVIGSAVNLPAIYASSSSGNIYRFSLNGIPDYQIIDN